MKIILRQDVDKLGEAGSVQTVADGYARNYLIPKGLAVMATPGALRHLEDLNQVRARKIAKQEQQLQSLAEAINGKTLTFTARAGEGGRLYGSVTAGDIAEKLSVVVKHEIDRRQIILPEPIRSLGEHTVTVKLVGRLQPQITVAVHSAEEEEAAAE